MPLDRVQHRVADERLGGLREGVGVGHHAHDGRGARQIVRRRHRAARVPRGAALPSPGSGEREEMSSASIGPHVPAGYG